MQLFINCFEIIDNLLSIHMPHIPNKHWDTPHKAALQAQAKLVGSEILHDANGNAVTCRQLFTHQHISPTIGYRIINSRDPRRLAHSEIRTETRGRKVQFTARDTQAVERVLWCCGFDRCVLSWDALALEARVDVSGRTV